MKKAGIYARLSLDIDGNGLGVARQVEDCTAKATGLGWQVVDIYEDNGISGSKGLHRPEYERMLEDLRSGRINAVVVYDLDRLTRRPMELEQFMELADTKGTALANVSGDVDLTTASGKMLARIKGAVARQEAERTGERVKRQKEQRLASGKPPASRYRTFGFTRDWQVIPEEAAVVRDVFERVAGGESLMSVTKWMRANDVKPSSGGFWHHTATQRLIDSRIYAGRLSYKGQDAGEADIPALIGLNLFNAANEKRERKPGRVNVRKSLLSGIVVCDVCKTRMIGATKGGRPVYTCDRIKGGCGNVSVKRSSLDDLIDANIWQVLAHDYKAKDDKPKADTKAQVDALNERIEKTKAALTSGALDYEDGLPMLADLRAKVKALTEAQTTPDTFHKVLTDFRAAELSVQSAEVKRHVSAILLRPAVRGRNTFDPARFDVVLRDGRVIPGPEFVENGFSAITAVSVKVA